MRVEKKAFAYRVPIGDYNYLQCSITYTFASVLFDFALKERLVNKTDAKI